MNARVPAQARERLQITLDEVIEPSSHRKYGHTDLVQLLAHADGFPEIIIGRMRNSFLEHAGSLAGSRHIRRAQRQVQNKPGKIRMEAGRTQVLGHPQQALAQLHSPTRRIEAIAIIVAT